MARASDPSGKSSAREDDPHARRAEVSISQTARISSRSKTDASRAFHRRNAPAYKRHSSAKRRIKTRFEESSFREWFNEPFAWQTFGAHVSVSVNANAHASVSKAQMVSLALAFSARVLAARLGSARRAEHNLRKRHDDVRAKHFFCGKRVSFLRLRHRHLFIVLVASCGENRGEGGALAFGLAGAPREISRRSVRRVESRRDARQERTRRA
jgi:hypothetical protein